MAPLILLVAVLSLVGCAGIQSPPDILTDATKAANAAADAAETAESNLTATCLLAEIIAADTPDRLAAIQAQCHAAFGDYNLFKQDWNKLSSAITSAQTHPDFPAIENVSYLLERVISDEKRFVDDVARVVEQFG